MSDDAEPHLPSGWVPLGTRRWLTPGLMIFLPLIFILVNATVQAFAIFTNWTVGNVVLGAAASVFLAAGVIVLAQRVRVGHPWVNFDTGELRRGRHTVAIASIDWARVTLGGRPTDPRFALTFGAAKRFTLVAGVRLGRRRAISDADRTQLIDVLRRTSIVIPVDKYDPTGRFADSSFPAYLTKDAAIEFVRHPPTALDSNEWARLAQL